MSKNIYTVENLYQRIENLDKNLPKGVEITNPIRRAIEKGELYTEIYIPASVTATSKRLLRKEGFWVKFKKGVGDKSYFELRFKDPRKKTLARSCKEICSSYLRVNKKVKQKIKEATDDKTEKFAGPISEVLKKLIETKNPGWEVVKDKDEDGWYVEKKDKASKEEAKEEFI